MVKYICIIFISSLCLLQVSDYKHTLQVYDQGNITFIFTQSISNLYTVFYKCTNSVTIVTHVLPGFTVIGASL